MANVQPRMMPAGRRDPLRLWLLRLALLLLPLYAAWWLGGAEWVLRALRVLANAWLPDLLNQGFSEIVLQEDQSWKVHTGLVIERTPEWATFIVGKTVLLRIVMGFPLLWALLLATPGQKLKRVAWGTLLMGGVSLLAIAGYIWALFAVMINHQPSIVTDTLVMPPFRVSAPPYPEWLFYLSNFAHFLALMIVPIIAPVFIWVMLCWRNVMRLAVSQRRRMRKMSDQF